MSEPSEPQPAEPQSSEPQASVLQPSEPQSFGAGSSEPQASAPQPPEPQSSIGTRLLALVLGILLAYGCVELLVRLVGHQARQQATESNKPAAASTASNDVRIVCLGESTTFAGGNESYPSQLQQLLQTRLPDKKVVVANCGTPGVTSTYLLEHFEETYNTYHPTLVVAMMGANDTLPTGNLDPSRQTGTDKALSGSRAYRLAVRLKSQVDEQRTQNKGASTPSTPSPASSGAPIALGQDDPLAKFKASPSFVTACQLKSRSTFEVALPYIKKAIEENPKDPRPYGMMATYEFCVRNDPGAAEGYLKSACTLCPEEATYLVQMANVQWALGNQDKSFEYVAKVRKANLLNLSGDQKLASEYLRFLQAKNLDEQAETFFAYLKKSGFRQDLALSLPRWYWNARKMPQKAAPYTKAFEAAFGFSLGQEARNNYQNLQVFSKKYNFKLVCMAYAGRSAEPFRTMFASQPDVIMVDNREPFRTMCENGEYSELFTDNFGGDFGHATARGNYHLAKNVADALEPLLRGVSPVLPTSTPGSTSELPSASVVGTAPGGVSAPPPPPAPPAGLPAGASPPAGVAPGVPPASAGGLAPGVPPASARTP